jgi:hypothetical protein
MTQAIVAQQRLYFQGLSHPRFKTPAEVVTALGAVQAQDYLAALWALGARLPGSTEAQVEQTVSSGEILRTHVMRPTWHFVPAADLRWMQELTAPRVRLIYDRGMSGMQLDAPLLARCTDLMARALEGGKQLTREELGAALAQAGIQATTGRLAYIAFYAELEAVLCSGARRGKQFTYALYAERAPQAQSLPRDHALAELVRRYFTAHGPATIADFVWWSGLTVTDAKLGLELVRNDLIQAVIDGQSYWLSAQTPVPPNPSPDVYLLPGYDEFLISYTDRSASLAQPHEAAWHRGNAVFSSIIVVDGEVVGVWKRTLKKKSVLVESTPFRPFSAAEQEAFKAAAQQYADFLGLALAFV